MSGLLGEFVVQSVQERRLSLFLSPHPFKFENGYMDGWIRYLGGHG